MTRLAPPSTLVVWMALAAVTVVFCFPLLVHDALPFGSDVVFASHSAHGFVQALREGILYPRWVGNSNRGFGGPTFIFYCPLPYYAVAAARLVTADLIHAFRLVLFTVAFLSGLTFYHCIRRLTSPAAALAGASLYILMPYHTLDLYDRFAFAEYAAFLWFPLLLYFLRQLLREPGRRAWFGLAAAYTGLLFTHLVTAYMVLFILAPYAGFHVLKTRRWKNLIPIAGAGLAAIFCASIYLIPMLAERDAVHLEWVIQAPYGNFHRNFVYRDEVAHGFTAAPIKPWVNQAATWQAFLGLAAALLLFVRFSRRLAGNASREPAAWTEGLAHLGLCGWTFFLQIPSSTPIWALVPQMATIQFPWRFGLFQALSTCLLLSCSLAPAREEPGTAHPIRHTVRSTLLEKLHGGKLLAAAIIVAGVIPCLATTFRIARNEYRPWIFDAALARQPRYLNRVMKEYLPQGMEGWKDFGATPSPLPSQVRLSGPGRARVAQWATHSREIEVNTPGANTLHLRTFYHPGWHAWVDQREVPIDRNNPFHAISIHLAPGKHRVRVVFGSTPDRKIGAGISTFSVATMIALGFLAWRRQQPA
ncbi:MAG: 6-pyruvoyl-tetrahydropterin synthase-related protein [Acidobacteriota bacterium]